MPKTKSTIVMDSDLWKRFRMIAILNEMEISELVEQALREKLERMKQLEQYPEYKDVEGLQVQRSKSQAEKGTTSSVPPLMQREPQTRESIGETIHGVVDNYAYSFSIPLPEIEKYPITKKELIQAVKELQNKFMKEHKKVPIKLEQALTLVQHLPENQDYKTETGLNMDLDILVNNTVIMEDVVGYPTKIRGCRIRFVAKNPTESTMKDMFFGDEVERDDYRQKRQEFLRKKEQQRPQPQSGQKQKVPAGTGTK